MQSSLSQIAPSGQVLSHDDAKDLVARAFPPDSFAGRKVLVIVPDGTRTCPLGLVFKAAYAAIGGTAKAFDVLIALGTHVPMSDEAIAERLELTPAERSGAYANVRFFNHAWD